MIETRKSIQKEMQEIMDKIKQREENEVCSLQQALKAHQENPLTKDTPFSILMVCRCSKCNRVRF